MRRDILSLAVVVIDSWQVLSPSSRKSDLYPSLLRIQADLHCHVALLFLDENLPPDPLVDSLKLTNSRIKILTPDVRRRSVLSKLTEVLPEQFRKTSPLWKFLPSPFPLFPLKLRYRNHLASARSFLRSVSASRIIALTSATNSGIVGALIAREAKVPLYIVEHKTKFARGFMTGAVGQAALFALESATKVVCVTDGLKADVEEWSDRRMRTRLKRSQLQTSVIPNPLSEDFFQNPGSTIEWIEDFRSGRFLFAAWTNWREIKRPDLLLEAFAEVVEEYRDSCLILAGPVPDWLPLAVIEKGLSSLVLITGEILRPEIHALAFEADVCVISSDFETFGLPAIEALAGGAFVVTTACGGPEHLIVRPELGTVVPRGETSELARAMRDSIYSQPGTRSFRQNFARQRFSENAVRKEWGDIFARESNQ